MCKVSEVEGLNCKLEIRYERIRVCSLERVELQLGPGAVQARFITNSSLI